MGNTQPSSFLRFQKHRNVPAPFVPFPIEYSTVSDTRCIPRECVRLFVCCYYIRNNFYFHRNHYYLPIHAIVKEGRSPPPDTIHVLIFLFNLIAFREAEDKLSGCRSFLSSSSNTQIHATHAFEEDPMFVCICVCHGRFEFYGVRLLQQKNRSDNSMHVEWWILQTSVYYVRISIAWKSMNTFLNDASPINSTGWNKFDTFLHFPMFRVSLDSICIILSLIRFLFWKKNQSCHHPSTVSRLEQCSQIAHGVT